MISISLPIADRNSQDREPCLELFEVKYEICRVIDLIKERFWRSTVFQRSSEVFLQQCPLPGDEPARVELLRLSDARLASYARLKVAALWPDLNT
jgi:hypothetical protein